MGLETYKNGTQYVLQDAEQISFSTVSRIEEGTGYGYMSFKLPRKKGSYSDFGFGYEVKLRKGLDTILFHGFISAIEISDSGYTINCLGYKSLLQWDKFSWVFRDDRVDRWVGGCEPQGSSRPDKFNTATSWDIENVDGSYTSYSGLRFLPKSGVDYVEEDYTYLRYRFENGETAYRIVFNWKSNFRNNWPGKFQIEDSDGNVLFMIDYSGEGSEDIIIDSGNFVMCKFIATDTGNNTAEDETIYFNMWNVNVYSCEDDIQQVFLKIADYMNNTYSFSSSTLLIEDVNISLPRTYFKDSTPQEVLATTSKYADIVWGLTYDDSKRFFLTTNSFNTEYKIHEPEPYSIRGDLTDTYQIVYAKYKDVFGIERYTSEVGDDDIIDHIGLHKKELIDVGDISEEEIDTALQKSLDDNKLPKVATSFNVKGVVKNQFHQNIDVDEIRAGAYLIVSEGLDNETSLLDSSNYLTFFISEVEVDYDNKEATLSPKDFIPTFDAYMEKLERD